MLKQIHYIAQKFLWLKKNVNVCHIKLDKFLRNIIQSKMSLEKTFAEQVMLISIFLQVKPINISSRCSASQIQYDISDE